MNRGVVGTMASYRKYLALTVVLTVGVALVAGCTTTTTTTTTEPKSTFKAAVVTDVGGLGDKAFNDLAWAGVEKAAKELGGQAKFLESKQIADYEPNIGQLAAAGYSPVIGNGFLMTDAMLKMAKQYPDTKFGGVDIVFTTPTVNAVGINFKEHEAGYLAGIVAGLATKETFDERLNKENIIGFVGGMEIPQVTRFEAGYIAGAKSVNPDVKVISIYTGTFEDQAKGKEAGLSLIGQKADVVFQVAGGTGLGTIKACQEAKALVIGVDADQFVTVPNSGDVMLTSAVKKVDMGVYLVCKATAEGKFPGGTNVFYGLKEGGVDLAPFHDFDAKVPQAIKDAAAKAKADIIAGTVVVSETAPK
jgi:basic membrane protein A